MNKNKSKFFKGIVVALKANFLIVEIDLKDDRDNSFDKVSEKIRLLCTRRSKLDYQGLFIDVGDLSTVSASAIFSINDGKLWILEYLLHVRMTSL